MPLVSHSIVSDSFVTPWTVAHQAPLSMGFPRQEYWSGLPFPSPGDLPDPGIKAGLLHCNWILYCLSHREPLCHRPDIKQLRRGRERIWTQVYTPQETMYLPTLPTSEHTWWRIMVVSPRATEHEDARNQDKWSRLSWCSAASESCPPHPFTQPAAPWWGVHPDFNFHL